MRSKRRNAETSSGDGSVRHFGDDDRAIEGLPIRLVIAIVIGVAAMALMMSMLDGLDQFNDEEITIDFQDDAVVEEGETFEVKVVDESGNGVDGAQVNANGDTANLGESGSDTVEETGAEGVTEFDVDPELPQGQDSGYIEFEIQPPSDSSYTEASEHERILVVSAD
ncbi:hypothetical protein [Natronolimnohabitans innermongolicus]|uniref:Carboxypeptidase regulatory-like domain-containing protein n=1 Tax=Natronolimnohabitans innermongolicus JCM 12255 TaxID=1227499 RepID=L9X7T8_9EURY|nr:hypothetical protein [Natronolimnohabitans innermongolicus]ELY56693.1 hypothetical protein C493_09975 [Natronolimnohabitans innermongolicus JCM 12255]